MKNISQWQMIFIGTALVADATLINAPSLVIAEAKALSWLAYLIAMAIVLVSLWLMSKVSLRFPEQDLIEAAITSYPWIGRAVILLYAGAFFYILIRDIRATVDFVNISGLPTTPLSVTSLMLVLSVLFIVLGRLEVVAGMSSLWQPALIMAVTAITFVLFREFRLEHLEPMMENGLGPAMHSAIILFPYVGEILLVPLVFGGRGYTMKTGMYGLIGGVLFLLLLNFHVVLTLGVHIPAKTLYPNYEMVRQIRLTDFLDRFDLPLVGVYVPAMIVKISYSYYFVSYAVHKVLPRIKYSYLCIVCGIVAYVLALLFFKNTAHLLELNYVQPYAAAFFQLALPMLFFLFLRPKKPLSAG
jgi:spore germination protein